MTYLELNLRGTVDVSLFCEDTDEKLKIEVQDVIFELKRSLQMGRNNLQPCSRPRNAIPNALSADSPYIT